MFSSSLHFLSFKGNIIWVCAVGLVMSSSVVYISFAKKVAIDCCYFIGNIVLIEIIKQIVGVTVLV